MKLIEITHPYLTGIHGASPLKPGSDAIIMHAWNDFQWRLVQLRMFLQELQEHTSKIDKKVYLKFLGVKFRIPAFGLKNTDKESLKRNRFQVERMLGQLGIIMLVSIVEYSCKDFCEALQRKMKLQLNWNELRGTPLSRFKTYYEKVGNISLEIPNGEWQYLTAIDRLRNTFAHSLGEIRDEDRKTLEKLAADNKGLQIINGYIYADMDFAHHAIDDIQQIIGVCVGKIGHPEIEEIMNKVREQRLKSFEDSSN